MLVGILYQLYNDMYNRAVSRVYFEIFSSSSCLAQDTATIMLKNISINDESMPVKRETIWWFRRKVWLTVFLCCKYAKKVEGISSEIQFLNFFGCNNSYAFLLCRNVRALFRFILKLIWFGFLKINLETEIYFINFLLKSHQVYVYVNIFLVFS